MLLGYLLLPAPQVMPSWGECGKVCNWITTEARSYRGLTEEGLDHIPVFSELSCNRKTSATQLSDSEPQEGMYADLP